MVDVQTQKSFEKLGPRSVAVVIDPVQSVKGRVVMDAFRSIHPHNLAMGTEPRITTANSYYTKERGERMAKLRGLNKLYYNMCLEATSVDEHEINVLAKLDAQHWSKAMLP